jgi:hypothetical protein
MSPVRVRDASDHRSASRNKIRQLSRTVAQADRTPSAEIEVDRPLVSRLAFVEDFTLEHSFPGQCITTLEIAGTF